MIKCFQIFLSKLYDTSVIDPTLYDTFNIQDYMIHWYTVIEHDFDVSLTLPILYEYTVAKVWNQYSGTSQSRYLIIDHLKDIH